LYVYAEKFTTTEKFTIGQTSQKSFFDLKVLGHIISLQVSTQLSQSFAIDLPPTMVATFVDSSTEFQKMCLDFCNSICYLYGVLYVFDVRTLFFFLSISLSSLICLFKCSDFTGLVVYYYILPHIIYIDQLGNKDDLTLSVL
jgi:hypothetical protein